MHRQCIWAIARNSYTHYVSRAPNLIRDARRAAGLTQTALARELGTTQSAIARLERPGSNPTVDMLDRALNAAGHRLDMTAKPALPAVDLGQIRAHLRMTPAQRLATFTASHRNIRRLVQKAKPGGGHLA